MLIRGLVYGEDEEDALHNAKYDVFEPLIRDSVFDYYVTFDEDGHGVSGRDRWGELPEAVEAETRHGEELIDEGWKHTISEYEKSLESLEEFFEEHEMSEIWEDPSVHSEFHHRFHRVGEYKGPGTYLYDQDGEGIRDKQHLERVLDRWEDLYEDENPYEDQDLYVVPADVHY
jgi:hypothetical protein